MKYFTAKKSAKSVKSVCARTDRREKSVEIRRKSHIPSVEIRVKLYRRQKSVEIRRKSHIQSVEIRVKLYRRQK